MNFIKYTVLDYNIGRVGTCLVLDKSGRQRGLFFIIMALWEFNRATVANV
jgi:hypothetical protein